MESKKPGEAGVVELVRVLVLVQGGIALVSTIEISFWAAFADPTGALDLAALLTAGLAFTTLVLAAGIGRRVRLARRLVLALEAFVLAAALVDLGLAVFIAHRPLGLVPMLTRIVLPVAVIVLLRRPAAREAFRSRRHSAAPAGAVA